MVHCTNNFYINDHDCRNCSCNCYTVTEIASPKGLTIPADTQDKQTERFLERKLRKRSGYHWRI